MFSQGQLVFAGIFFVAFVVAAVYVYRKDAAIHKREYKGSYRVLIGFLIFIAFLFFIKGILKE